MNFSAEIVRLLLASVALALLPVSAGLAAVGLAAGAASLLWLLRVGRRTPRRR